jgi:PAS domain S-box-containing protein
MDDLTGRGSSPEAGGGAGPARGSPSQPAWSEADRLAALARYGILDTPPEPAFDDLVRLAADICEAPIAAVNLVAGDRQWFKSELGLGVRETPLDVSICAHAILEADLVVVPDTTQDARFADNPLVTAVGGLRFYAGALLKSSEGLPLGTLCVLDRMPRPGGITERQRLTLTTLASQAMAQLELRRALEMRDCEIERRRRVDARFVAMVDSATDYALFSTDAAGRIVTWNPGAANIFGWGSEEALGQPSDMIFTPEDRAARAPELEREGARREGKAADERWHLRKDGSRFFASGQLMRLRDGEEGYLKIVRDRTEQRKAEADLAESEAKFRAITESVDQMIWSTLPDGYHDYYNQRWYEYTGVPEGSTDGEAWNDLFHPEDQSRAWDVWRRSLQTGETYRIEYRLRHRSGQYRWVLGRAQPVRDPDGRITRWFGTCTDIQEIVEAREVLARSREELEREISERTRERDRVWRVSRDLYVVCGFDGLYRGVNPAWSDQLGYPPDELAGTRFDALVHPDDRPSTQRAFDRLVQGEVVTDFDVRVRSSDGSYRWYSWTCVPEDAAFYAAGRDVTARKELEEQLRQAQKMETVGQLTGGVAHDFNNLLQIVTGNLEILLRNLPADAPRLRRSAENAMTGAKRAAVLTQRLLAFSRRQPLAPKPIEVNRLVGHMSEILHRTLGETVELETALAPDLWRVEADPNQLENALLNLAINARDAMPNGGKLTIETANQNLEGISLSEGAETRPGDCVTIRVSDTGVGMNEETLARVFEPFFTTKEVGKGTGLGLSQVYGFVKQSGGQVRLFSEPGRGTAVRIDLPRLVGKPEEPVELNELAAPPGRSGETILVCEDNDDVRAYSVEVLRELGYRVLEAHDGSSALRLLERQEGRVDLLFTDIVLPSGTNGAQLAELARAARPGLKVLFTTGYARDAMVHHGRLDRGVELITKPFGYADLAARVRSILDGRAAS